MPRTKDAEHRKTHTIQIRVSPQQLALLEHAAGSAHLELSTWIRYVVLQHAGEKFDVSKVGAKSSRARKVHR